jgi:hypothetical protein
MMSSAVQIVAPAEFEGMIERFAQSRAGIEAGQRVVVRRVFRDPRPAGANARHPDDAGQPDGSVVFSELDSRAVVDPPARAVRQRDAVARLDRVAADVEPRQALAALIYVVGMNQPAERGARPRHLRDIDSERLFGAREPRQCVGLQVPLVNGVADRGKRNAQTLQLFELCGYVGGFLHLWDLLHEGECCRPSRQRLGAEYGPISYQPVKKTALSHASRPIFFVKYSFSLIENEVIKIKKLS